MRRDPALLKIIGIVRTDRGEQRDGRAVGVGGFIVAQQMEIIDARAGQIDRTGKGTGLDCHALGSSKRIVARCKDLGAGIGRRRRTCNTIGAGRCQIGKVLRLFLLS